MDLDTVAETIIRAHAKRGRGRSYKPELLKKLSSRPRKAEVRIDYSIDGGLDWQYTAPGSYAGDFGGGGGGTQHATRVRYVAGQTDRASGVYARSRVSDVGLWRNDQPMMLDAALRTRKVRHAVQAAVAAAREALANQRSSYERWVRETLDEPDTVSCSNVDHLLLTPITAPDGRLRVKATCMSCGAVSEAGPGQWPVMLHDELSCRFDFCEMCGGRAVERGAECVHGEGRWAFFVRGEDGVWREMRGTDEMIREACRG